MIQTGIGRKFLRTIWEDRSTFNASREFFRRWRSIFGRNHEWSLEHMIFKQRWYRGGTGRFNKILQGLGDSGLNLLPLPRGINSWLYSKPLTSALLNYGFYPTAFAGEYLIYNLASQLGETMCWFSLIWKKHRVELATEVE
jgi:hypothetical protein